VSRKRKLETEQIGIYRIDFDHSRKEINITAKEGIASDDPQQVHSYILDRQAVDGYQVYFRQPIVYRSPKEL